MRCCRSHMRTEYCWYPAGWRVRCPAALREAAGAGFDNIGCRCCPYSYFGAAARNSGAAVHNSGAVVPSLSRLHRDLPGHRLDHSNSRGDMHFHTHRGNRNHRGNRSRRDNRSHSRSRDSHNKANPSPGRIPSHPSLCSRRSNRLYSRPSRRRSHDRNILLRHSL
jgi:hypothetical protein